MKSLAIIGTGIAGMGSARKLFPHFDLTVFEQDGRIGGHTNTVFVTEGNERVAVDTGFIVCNNENYPNLMQLFSELKTPLKKTSMSFSAQIMHEHLEYCGSSLAQLFVQKKNIFSPRYIRFLMQLSDFNKHCLEILTEEKLQAFSIAEYCRYKKYNDDLLNWYLLPMSSALWSTPPDTTATFPALTLVRFFKNHGFLGLNTQFQWYTVEGGSEMYKKALIAPFKDRIKTEAKVVRVMEAGDQMQVVLEDGSTHLFDLVLIATHADQAAGMIDSSFTVQRNMLQPFQYEKNLATLHTDATLMPKKKNAWSSWNYRIVKSEQQTDACCTYWMNSLQGVSEHQQYFVTINGNQHIAREKIIREITYEHPVFTVEAMQQQQSLVQINDKEIAKGKLFFCGSYFRYGFHEDAYASGLAACRQILEQNIPEISTP